MIEPIWLDSPMVRAMHAQAIWFFGGSDGLRDRGLLESALSKPKNFYAYEPVMDIFSLASFYVTGLVQNLPFIDANECVAIIAANSFLNLNGYTFCPTEKDLANTIMNVAAGQTSDAELSIWLRDCSKKNIAFLE
jgi:death-on-curing protein